MSRLRKLCRTAAAAMFTAAGAAPAIGQERPYGTMSDLYPSMFQPAGHLRRSPCPAPCPAPCVPCPAPGLPAVPGMPSTPTVPSTPGMPPSTSVAPAPTIPSTPTTPSFAGAEAGAGLSATAAIRTGTMFGDLLGGGVFAGPLPQPISPGGQFIGPAPVVILPNGQRVTLNNPGGQRTPADEALFTRVATLPANTPGGTVIGLLPPPGTVFAPEFADLGARVPLDFRGAFKITENDTPRPTTRVYASYYFYDQVSRGVGGPNTPRIMVHQEVIGYEQAFLDNRFSVGLRLPYNQIVSPRFFNDTSLADLTLISKGVIWENRDTGDLLSGGLVVTVPTAETPFPSTITGQNIHSTLLQPYLGYILMGRDVFLQGFTSVVVPTDDQDVTFMSNDLAIGCFLYEARGQALSGIVPVVEMHLNTPFNHRNPRAEPIGFFDQFTMLGGTQFYFYDRSSLGLAAGAPLTGPRPFSLQATVQFNFRF